MKEKLATAGIVLLLVGSLSTPSMPMYTAIFKAVTGL